MSISNFKDRNGVPITDWRKWTPPASSTHWKAGHSAMELARAWFTSPVPVCPPEIQSLLASTPRTTGIVFTEGFPEHVTPLPYGINGRHHDLMLCGQTIAEKVIVCVEAKADEKFDRLIHEYSTDANAKVASGTPTHAPERLKALLEIVFGTSAVPDQTPWSDLRYQLLQAVAGTAIQAANDDAPLAVFIVHEFQTAVTDATKIADNDADYKKFVEAFCSPPDGIVSGQLYGPVRLHSGANLKHDVDVFIGKAIYEW